jgi:hypothetical protein
MAVPRAYVMCTPLSWNAVLHRKTMSWQFRQLLAPVSPMGIVWAEVNSNKSLR